jgi:hypothetical protein
MLAGFSLCDHALVFFPEPLFPKVQACITLSTAHQQMNPESIQPRNSHPFKTSASLSKAANATTVTWW